MPKIKEEPVDPMQVYLEGSDWKHKCAKLLEALVLIKLNSSKGWIQDTAIKAIKQFEENK